MPKVKTKITITPATNYLVTDFDLLTNDLFCKTTNIPIEMSGFIPREAEDVKKIAQAPEKNGIKHKIIWQVDADHTYLFVLPGDYNGENWTDLMKDQRIPIVAVKDCQLLLYTSEIIRDVVSQAYTKYSADWDKEVITSEVTIDTDYVQETDSLLGNWYNTCALL